MTPFLLFCLNKTQNRYYGRSPDLPAPYFKPSQSFAPMTPYAPHVWTECMNMPDYSSRGCCGFAPHSLFILVKRTPRVLVYHFLNYFSTFYVCAADISASFFRIRIKKNRHMRDDNMEPKVAASPIGNNVSANIFDAK